ACLFAWACSRVLHSFPARRSADLGGGGGCEVSSGAFWTQRPCAVHVMPSPQSLPGRQREMHVPSGPQCEPGEHSLSSVHLGSARSEEHTSELQSRENLVCRLLLAK